MAWLGLSCKHLVAEALSLAFSWAGSCGALHGQQPGFQS